MTDDSPVVDDSRSIDIDGEWTAAVVIYSDGIERLWLLCSDDAGTPGCACPGCAPHEQLDVQSPVDSA